MNIRHTIFLVLAFALLLNAGCSREEQAAVNDTSEPEATLTIKDGAGRSVEVPASVDRVICSGPGCLRLLTYLRAQAMIVGVDDIELRNNKFDARPYALANPQFASQPLFGEFRGHDNPELIVALSPQPQVIFKTYRTMGHDPVELQRKTGVPVITLEYGNLTSQREELYQSILTMGQVTGTQERAQEIIDYFDGMIADLAKRTEDIPETERKTCFIGGIAKKGPHGFQSTEPLYPPFRFTGANNVAYDQGLPTKDLQHANVAKEVILEWDPEILFLDLSTLQIQGDGSGLQELMHDPAYQELTAVKNGEVYGVLPYNWYSRNYGSIFADAYFVGKILYPEQFEDIDPAAKAGEIYEFLVGKNVFPEMDQAFGNLAFKRVPLN